MKRKFCLNDELELWQEIKKGCTESKLKLFKKYLPQVIMLSRTLSNSCISSINSDDLYSIGIEKLWFIIDDFEPEQGNTFWTFANMRIFGTMKTVLRDRKNIDRKTYNVHLEFEREKLSRMFDVDEHIEYKKKVQLVDYLLQRLTKKERIIAVEVFMNGLKSPEVAKILQSSAGSVKTQVWSLRKKMKLIAEKYFERMCCNDCFQLG